MLETKSKSWMSKQSVGRMLSLLLSSEICVLSVAAVVFEWWERKEDCCSVPSQKKEGSGGRAPGVHLFPRRHAVGRTPVATCASSAPSAARCLRQQVNGEIAARAAAKTLPRTEVLRESADGERLEEEEERLKAMKANKVNSSLNNSSNSSNFNKSARMRLHSYDVVDAFEASSDEEEDDYGYDDSIPSSPVMFNNLSDVKLPSPPPPHSLLQLVSMMADKF